MQTTLVAPPRAVTADQVREVVGRMLKMDPGCLDPARSLASYGLNSLSAVELVASLEDAFGQRLPDWLLAEHPTLAALCDVMCGTETADRDELSLMRADSRLPLDIRPHASPRLIGLPRRVLLTGATGFLGAYLVRELLDDPAVHVTCLVRSRTGDGRARVRTNLELYGLWQPSFASRIEVAAGDLVLGSLGLPARHYDHLAHSIEAVYHAGADVNWVLPYSAVRDTNVRGTIELLRLACTGPSKQFHFVSSLSVCYATNGPGLVTEQVDMLPHLANLPLGYAQSKCVAETLVRQAAARGLDAKIYRPALIAGDARTGASNVEDLISALLKGCIQMGAAPDLDWAFDAVPVDYAARAIVKLARTTARGPRTIHLRHPRPRHWRECILLANVFGYPVQLVPFHRWRDRLEREATSPTHALHRLRSFFMRRVSHNRTVAELYEERTRSSVIDSQSRIAHQAVAVDYPTLDADVLERYFHDYVERGFLSETSSGRRPASPAGAASIEAEIEPIFQGYFADTRCLLRGADLVSAGSEHSIIGELLSWRTGQRAGLSHYRLDLDRTVGPLSLDVIVKAKAADDEVLDLGEMIADVCDPRVARELRRCRNWIGIRGSHRRELALYEHGDHRLRRHMPVCYGTWRREETASWGLVLERLDDMVLMNASDEVWVDSHIAAAIDGLATIHSAWLGRERELRQQSWIGHIASADSMQHMTPLWQSLAAHAAPRFAEWAGPCLVKSHQRLSNTVSRWWPALEAMPRTLVHNDFNSRNIALRRTESAPRLVAYDWELATIGVPQRDLAELLCFVLPPDATAGSLTAWVERHRRHLEHESGMRLSPGPWRVGFAGALAEFLVTRLAFYALVDRVKCQTFLPRVLRTWQRLYELSVEG